MLVSQFFLLFFRLLCYTVPVTMISMKEEVIIMEKLMSVDLGAGVVFHWITDPRFKSNRLSLHFVLPMEDAKRSSRAILPYLWVKRCREYPDMISLSCRLADLYGAGLGAKVDKLGPNQVLSVAVTGLDDRFTFQEEGQLSQCAQLLCQLVQQPYWEEGLFSQEDLETEKQTLSDLIEAKINDKRRYSILRATELLFGPQGGGLDPLGTLEQVEALTPESVTEAYRQVLKEGQIHLFFVGCGDPSVALEVFQKAFTHWDRDPKPVSPLYRYRAGESRRVVERMDVTQSKLVLCLSSGLQEEEDPFAAQMASVILGGTPSSKLFLNVREKLSLCYYCSCQLALPSGVLLVSSGVEHEKISAAYDEMMHQLSLMQQGEVTRQELEQAQKAVLNSYRTVGDSLAAQESYYMQRILYPEVRSPLEEAQLLGQVTLDQIIQAAKRIQLQLCYTLTGLEKEEG